MNVLLLLNCFLFVITLSEYLICMKYINYEYEYKNAWFNILLSVSLTPSYFILLIKDVNRNKLREYAKPENRIQLFYPFATGFLYTIETIMLFYALNTLTLSYYTILRSGFILFNIPFFKYLLHKKITAIYLSSCVLLVISHVIIITNYANTQPNASLPINTLIIFISCFLNATYNNVIEYSVKKYKIPNIDFQIFFQITYFLFIIGPSIYYTVQDLPPIDGLTMVLYAMIALGLQMYMYNKIYILNNRNDFIPANILLSSLDLLRRIIQLLFSFLFFDDQFDTYVVLSLLFLAVSSFLLLYQYFHDNRIIRHVELEEVNIK
jgi:drug/metabolite transporter (DMT)-like permease